MSTATAEIVDINSAVNYLEGLSENIAHTCNAEIEILLAGLANVRLEDPDVISNIHAARDGMTGVLGNIAGALGRLKGAHTVVSETVAAAGQDNVARDSAFYAQH